MRNLWILTTELNFEYLEIEESEISEIHLSFNKHLQTVSFLETLVFSGDHF